MSNYELKFSEEIFQCIDSIVKESSKKEKLYNEITKFETGSFGSFQYERLKMFIEEEYLYKGLAKTYDVYSINTGCVNEAVIKNLLDLFKEVKNSEFISTPDKRLVMEYANVYISGYSHSGGVFSNPEEAIKNKLGIKFQEWFENWDREKVSVALINVVTEAIDKYDTHRYSDEVIECFTNAVSKNNFVEALSECHYMMNEQPQVIGVDQEL